MFQFSVGMRMFNKKFKSVFNTSGIWSKMRKKTRQKLSRSIKKHESFLIVLSLVLSVVLGVAPFLIEDRLVIIQRVRVINLPTITGYQASSIAEVKVTASVFVTITRANGSVEYIQGQ
jgi:hypothetical protein